MTAVLSNTLDSSSGEARKVSSSVNVAAGTLMLLAANTYTGSTTVAGGTLLFTTAGSLPILSNLVIAGGTVVVTGIDIVFDEGTDVGVGYAWLDNVDVNGTLIGKPGNAK